MYCMYVARNAERACRRHQGSDRWWRTSNDRKTQCEETVIVRAKNWCSTS